jgi:hypothetical protein
MNLLRLLVNQMRMRSTDQSNPHSARSADVSRRQVRRPGARGERTGTVCTPAQGSRAHRLRLDGEIWPCARPALICRTDDG